MRYQQGMNLQPPQRHLHHVVLLEGRGQWPQAVGVKKWTRYDNNADCFRVSSSQGPMWSDVTRRRAVDLDTGKVVADEKFTGDERPRMLSRALPQGVKNIETSLFYRPRPGHPDPGVPVDDQADRGADMDEDRRLFDRGLKRGHDGSSWTPWHAAAKVQNWRRVGCRLCDALGGQAEVPCDRKCARPSGLQQAG